jgi:RNA polymerase-associated protein RTF1
MDMNEIEREEILAQRLEEMQRLQDQRSLDQLVRMQRGGAPAADDSISKSAKRELYDSDSMRTSSHSPCPRTTRRKRRDEGKDA